MVLGCAGSRVGRAEGRFFADAQPLGFILFARNCHTPDQVRALVEDLRASVGRADAPVLIDQEGGRVARLGPPHWRTPPAAARFAALAGHDRRAAEEAVRLNARLIAADLAVLGIGVDCAPVLDILQAESWDVIGDRAFGDSAETAEALGRAFCEGCLEGGVLPVIKHIPGHGRAAVDSHHALPVVDAPRDALEATDFAPFRGLRDMPWAMTAHVVYRAVDAANPATTSAPVIGEVIRGSIGFDGVLISDDLSMGALSGGLGERARAALAAGCDLALHCNGGIAEMEAVAAATGPLSEAARARLARGEAMRRHAGDFDAATAAGRVDALLAGAAAP